MSGQQGPWHGTHQHRKDHGMGHAALLPTVPRSMLRDSLSCLPRVCIHGYAHKEELRAKRFACRSLHACKKVCVQELVGTLGFACRNCMQKRFA